MTLKEITIITGTTIKKTKVARGWLINLYGVEVKRGGVLVSAYGDAKTITAAKEDYAKKLCNQTIVVNAMRSNRQEFRLPPKITAR